jgi:hypothetical protein
MQTRNGNKQKETLKKSNKVNLKPVEKTGDMFMVTTRPVEHYRKLPIQWFLGTPWISSAAAIGHEFVWILEPPAPEITALDRWPCSGKLIIIPRRTGFLLHTTPVLLSVQEYLLTQF